ncbi:MAG: nuclease-related domain-containing protein [Mariprofundaceae bacterium]
MIVKEADSLQARKLELEILKKYNLPSSKSYLIEQEWKRLISGEKGEENTAYFLNFRLKDSKNNMVIHDLRIVHNGQVAQIDHLIITRMLEIYVLETKAYGDTLEICDDGSFIASYPNGRRFGVKSPIEQNKRHIYLLKQAIKELNLAPKRLGISLSFEFKGFVLIDEKTKVARSKKFDSTEVIKADQFFSLVVDAEPGKLSMIDIFKQVGKIVSSETVQEISGSLVSLHVKSNVNYKERFDVADENLTMHQNNICEQNTIEHLPKNSNSRNYCAQCRVTIPSHVAKFCFDRKPRFRGRAYCMNCQKSY